MSNSTNNQHLYILEKSFIRVFEDNTDKYISVEEIKKGTCIIEDNKSAFVESIIKTKYTGPICKKYYDNISIGITPYYPIYINNNWIYAINSNLFEIENVKEVYVYSLFLEGYGYENIHQIELFGGIIARTLNNETNNNTYFNLNS